MYNFSGDLASLNRFVMCQCQHREDGWRICPGQRKDVEEGNKPAHSDVPLPLDHITSSSSWMLS